MKRTGLGGVLTALVMILVLSTFIFLFARNELDENPSATSPYPAGLGAFAELLRQEGLKVVVDHTERPSLQPDDLAIACSVASGEDWRNTFKPSEKTLTRLTAHLKKSGRVLELRFPSDFSESSRKAIEAEVIDKSSYEQPQIVTVCDTLGSGLDIPTKPPSYEAWTRDDNPFVTVTTVHSGALADVKSAMGATNRFLARQNNADFFLSLVRKLVKPGGKIVFVEATIGDVESQSLLATFGPWAVTAQWQLVLLLGVMAYAVSRRFGIPVDDPPRQQGARQLLDAMAEVLRSSKKQEFSASVIAASALDSVRAHLRLAPSATKDEILSKATPKFRAAYAALESARNDRLSTSEIVEAVRTLTRSLQ